MKICKICGNSKNLSEFYIHASCKDGRRPECKDCKKDYHVAKSKAYVANNPEKRKSTVLKNKYNIELSTYNKMLAAQNNLCKICKSSDPGPKGTFAVDHCHSTGKVRGLLCYSCNTGLGFFKDNIDNMIAATNYLKENSND